MIGFVRPKIILGCGNFGGVGSLPELIESGDSRQVAQGLLEDALRLGIVRFDTANTYGGGLSETILGEWIAQLPASVRNGVRISTKVGNPHGCPKGERPLSRRQVLSHLETSLRRLGVEQIDVFYLHELDPATPLEETLEAISVALQRGAIAGFGLSNVTREEVQRCLDLAGPSLGKKLSHVQNEFHALHTVDAEELIPFLSSRAIRYVAFGPLAGGLLSGKYENPEQPPPGSRLSLRPEPYQRFLTPEARQKLLRFLEEARRLGKAPAEAAVQFVLNTSGVDSVIIGPRKREHYESLGFKFGTD